VKVFVIMQDDVLSEYYSPRIMSVHLHEDKANKEAKRLYEKEGNFKLFTYKVVQFDVDEEN